MEFLPLALVLASAVSHGLWNYLAKEGNDKESFMLLLNIDNKGSNPIAFYWRIPDCLGVWQFRMV